MHIPDGFVSVPGGASAAPDDRVRGRALRQTRHELGERQTPLMGILAAFIFAAPDDHFPGGGRHVRAPAEAGVLVAGAGWSLGALMVMTAVLTVQALCSRTADWLVGLHTVFNMGAFAPFTGYGGLRRRAEVFRTVRNGSPSRCGGGRVGIGRESRRSPASLELADGDIARMWRCRHGAGDRFTL